MLKSKWFRIIARVIQFLVVLYLGLMLLVFLMQRRMLFQPTKASPEIMARLAEERGLQPWNNEVGQFIGWKQIGKSTSGHGRLLIVHGNAGCAVDRADYANALRLVEPLDVYLLEYPGYGARGGSPSAESLFQAGDEAIDLLKQGGPIYLMGESLGTGLAAYLAGKHPGVVRGMLLIAPYNSLTDVAQAHMPIFPVWLLMRDRFPAAKFLQNYHGPVAMLFAGQDVVVPNRFGHKLYDSYEGPKKFWQVPQAGHNDLLNQPDEWWRGLSAFWNENAPSTTPPK